MPDSMYGDYQVESLIINGIEQVPVPVPLSDNIIVIGVQPFNTRLADFINSLSLPNFYAAYPSIDDMTDIFNLNGLVKSQNSIRLITEVGLDFTLITSIAGGLYHRLTPTNSEISGDGGMSYIMDADDMSYLFHKRLCEEV